MAQRVLIGLHPGADLAKVMDAVRKHGAHVSAPDPSLPDVLVATTESPAVQTFIARAKAIPGVRYAEADSWQSTM